VGLLTYRRHLESLRKKLTSRVALLRRLARSGWGAGATTLRTATVALVHSTAEYCAPVWCRSAHTRLTDPSINDTLWIVTGCMRPTPANNLPILAGIQPAELRRSGATLSLGRWAMEPGHLLHSALTLPSSPHARRLKSFVPAAQATHQFVWQQHTCSAVGGSSMECGVGGQPHKTPHFNSRHRYPPPQNEPPKKSLGPAQPSPHRCRTFPLLLVQMGYGHLCGLWMWRRKTSRRPCCPPMSNPSTSISPWTAWPDGYRRLDNRMAAQHLARNLARPSRG